MNYNELVFSEIEAAMSRSNITKIIDYITSSLPTTFDYPWQSMDEENMLGFLGGVRQIYLKYWNSNSSSTEYIPDFTKESTIIHQEYEYIMREIVSLLRFMKYYAYSLSRNSLKLRII